MVELDVEIPTHLTTWIPSHNVDTTKLVPPNLRGGPLEFPRSATITFVHL